MNEEKFTGKADLYDRFRPSYPDALIDFLYENARCDTVADIGAGTGKFTRCLLKKPWKVVAVEPNADMRGKLSEIAGISVVDAPAENTGLSDHSVGLVTAAQAFHWFDEEKFKTECRRILTANGQLAVIWNDYLEEGLAARQTEICRKYSTDPQMSRTGHTGNHKDSGYFLCGEYFAECKAVKFYSERVLDLESFIGETLSRSHAIGEDHAEYGNFIGELKEAFKKCEENGFVTVKCETICYLGRF